MQTMQMSVLQHSLSVDRGRFCVKQQRWQQCGNITKETGPVLCPDEHARPGNGKASALCNCLFYVGSPFSADTICLQNFL